MMMHYLMRKINHHYIMIRISYTMRVYDTLIIIIIKYRAYMVAPFYFFADKKVVRDNDPSSRAAGRSEKIVMASYKGERVVELGQKPSSALRPFFCEKC